MNASAAGKWIFVNKAVPSIQSRPALHRQVIAHTKPLRLPGVPPLAVQANIPASRIVPYFRRLTKALLYRLYPEYDYFLDSFGVTKDSLNNWNAELPLLKHESRGQNIFDVWHSLDTDEDGTTAGTWIYRIYGDSVFSCRHSKKPRFTVEYPKGYKEHPKLPKYL